MCFGQVHVSCHLLSQLFLSLSWFSCFLPLSPHFSLAGFFLQKIAIQHVTYTPGTGRPRDDSKTRGAMDKKTSWMLIGMKFFGHDPAELSVPAADDAIIQSQEACIGK